MQNEPTYPVIYHQNKGSLTIEIFHEEYPDLIFDPRKDDNLGLMVCWHNHYELGDKHNFSDPREFDAYVKEKENQIVIVLPLFLYDHSVQAISTQSWAGRAQHAEWDSGQVGYVYTTRRRIHECLNIERLTKKAKDRVQQALENETETYNHYIQGRIFGWCIRGPANEPLETCTGYVGDWDEESTGLLPDVRATAQHILADMRKKRQAKIKALVRKNVSLEKRPKILQHFPA